jgi:hypothetical protein
MATAMQGTKWSRSTITDGKLVKTRIDANPDPLRLFASYMELTRTDESKPDITVALKDFGHLSNEANIMLNTEAIKALRDACERFLEDSRKVYYIIGESKNNGLSSTTYHVAELERGDAEMLNALRSKRDASLQRVEPHLRGFLRGSSDYNRIYNGNVAEDERAYRDFYRRLHMKQVGIFRSDGQSHSKGEILEKNAIEFIPNLEC